MSKKAEQKLASARKWLEKNVDVGATVKPAQNALAAAERALADAQVARAKYTAAITSKAKSLEAVEIAMAKTRAEKKLKAKELRLQSKLAALVDTDKPEKSDKA
ncbi:MAG: hypothetical protein JXM71_01840 [Spirochaetales bacterium]|nr:hypothetical protein [Spirochaetales bacterium]